MSFLGVEGAEYDRVILPVVSRGESFIFDTLRTKQ